MESIKNLLNKISNFKCKINETEMTFPGVLQEKKGIIVLNSLFSLEDYLKIPLETEFTVLGTISGKEATLMECHIHSASCAIGEDQISLTVIPSKIIVGKYFYSTPTVKKITIVTPDLNYMFFGLSPFRSNYFITKEDSSVLNFTFPESISAKDKYGEVTLYQTFETQHSVTGYTHNIISAIVYSFTNQTTLTDALSKVSAARSLFTFFGNGFIPFGEISFEDDAAKSQYSLYLNFKEDVSAVDEPFLITVTAFENQFQKVWGTWLDLYETAGPISTLFYEIVCNRSTGINSFLNLSQAIEVYSNTYRNAEAKAVAKSDPLSISKEKTPRLKHRYLDILSAYNNVLELAEPTIDGCAQGLSNMRNYYTHYNSKSYVKPSYDELFSAISILRFVLLAIVYTAVGISPNCILECKKRIIFHCLDVDASVILDYSKKKLKEVE